MERLIVVQMRISLSLQSILYICSVRPLLGHFLKIVDYISLRVTLKYNHRKNLKLSQKCINCFFSNPSNLFLVDDMQDTHTHNYLISNNCHSGECLSKFNSHRIFSMMWYKCYTKFGHHLSIFNSLLFCSISKSKWGGLKHLKKGKFFTKIRGMGTCVVEN